MQFFVHTFLSPRVQKSVINHYTSLQMDLLRMVQVDAAFISVQIYDQQNSDLNVVYQQSVCCGISIDIN